MWDVKLDGGSFVLGKGKRNGNGWKDDARAIFVSGADSCLSESGPFDLGSRLEKNIQAVQIFFQWRIQRELPCFPLCSDEHAGTALPVIYLKPFLSKIQFSSDGHQLSWSARPESFRLDDLVNGDGAPGTYDFPRSDSLGPPHESARSRSWD